MGEIIAGNGGWAIPVDNTRLFGRIPFAWPIRLAAQDAALSRQKHEFESRMGHTDA